MPPFAERARAEGACAGDGGRPVAAWRIGERRISWAPEGAEMRLSRGSECLSRLSSCLVSPSHRLASLQ